MDAGIAAEVRAAIESELFVGANSRQIEAFFAQRQIVFSYDRFNRRYSGIIRDVAVDNAIDQDVVIYIYVDNQRRFEHAEVEDSFTAP
jgi:hypothetical protein